MPLRLHNTASGKKEEFRPLGDEVTMYTCGPTVYNVAHIGNLSSFLAADVLKRWLLASGFRVKHVMNVTDVDDKTIRGAQAAGVPLSEFTATYEALFREDLRRLNVVLPTIVHATKNIEAMVADVQALLEKGLAYGKDGSVYFAIGKFPGYGQLAGLAKRKKGPAKHRIDTDDYDKDAAEDFVLWKGWKEEDGPVFWETPLGKGRPGWHIECSAMIRRHLGDRIDIHTGAADLVFPHHTNEIAQAEGVTGKSPFVRYWFHRGFLTMSGEKMAKRVGNVLTLADVATSDLEALAFRWLIVSSHYRSPLNFTDESMPAAKKSLGRILMYLSILEKDRNSGPVRPELDGYLASLRKRFIEAMNDDLNTPVASAVLFDLLGKYLPEELNRNEAEMIRDFIFDVDKTFGTIERAFSIYTNKLKSTVGATEEQEIIYVAQSRSDENYLRADQIREKLAKKGINLQIQKNGVITWWVDPWKN